MGTHRHITLQIPQNLAEIVAALLIDLGAQAAHVDDDETRALLRLAPTGRAEIRAAFETQPGLEARVVARLHRLFTHLQPEPQVDISWNDVEDQDWSQSWKQRWQVQHLGRRLVVCPSWLSYSPRADELVIELDPGMAFGTGTHETTRLCAEAIERHMQRGQSLLDVGCGSGILALFALKLGAGVVVATDKDPEAVSVARDNARANALEHRLQILRSDHVEVPGFYDRVVANILKQPLIDLSPVITARVAASGIVLLSGLLVTQLDEVAGAYAAQGLVEQARRTDGEWGLLELRRG